jgi:predicted PurR-regulated permease PerM
MPPERPRVQPNEPATGAASDSSTPVTPERRPSIRLVPALAVIVGLWWAQVVLIPLVLSVLVSYALEPFVSRMGSIHIPRPLAVPLVLTALISITGFGIYGLRSEVVLFVEQLPALARTVRQALQPDPRDQPGPVAKVQQAAQELETAAKEAAGPRTAPAGVTPVRIEEPTFKWRDYLWQGSRGVLEFAGQLFVMLCLVYYLLASGDLYKRKEGNVLTPWLMSRVGRMNAVAVFVSLLFWGWIWGVWGLLLAVPIMAAVKAACERIEDLSSYAELLKE